MNPALLVHLHNECVATATLIQQSKRKNLEIKKEFF
jgi:hypothetical protein